MTRKELDDMEWTQRFDRAWALDAATGCHIWQRAKNNRGYGMFWLDGKVRLAHRVAWYRATGQWPGTGLVTDHLCDTKACVNDEHLAEVTNRFNVLRSPLSPMNVTAARTACNRGHTYQAGTYRLDSKGHRQCRACAAIRRGGGRHTLVQS